MLKQAKRRFFYLKLLYEANSVQHRNVKFTSFQPSRAHYNPTIIYFTSASKNLTQFVKVLLVKLSEMLHSSNLVRLFHRQSFALYGINNYSGMLYTHNDWLNKFYSCYMGNVAVIVNGCGLSIGTHCRH